MSKYLGLFLSCLLFSTIVIARVTEVNQFGDPYLDRIGNQHIQSEKSSHQNDDLQKQQSGDKDEQLKPIQLNPDKIWAPSLGPSWSQHKTVNKPSVGDSLLNLQPKVLPNIKDVAETNYQRHNLRLKDKLRTVQLADADDMPQPHPVAGASLKDLNHAAYAADINAAAVPNQLSGAVHNSPTPQPPPGHPIQHDVTSKNPSAEKQQQKVDHSEYVPMYDIYFIGIVAGCSVAGLVGIIVAAVCWYRLQRNVKAASDVDYPAYGVTGPTKDRLPSPGDRKLAQSAQMYHYQHQKQQMIALEKANGEMKHDATDDDSEEENEEGDYTVYECPGLAPTGEMEVKNPLFNDESTQMTSGNEVTNGLQPAPTPSNNVEDEVGLSPQ